MTELPKPFKIPVVVKVVRVSGTIRKAEEEVIRRAKDIVLRAKMADGADKDIVNGIVRAVEKRKEAEVLVVEEEGDESDSESA